MVVKLLQALRPIRPLRLLAALAAVAGIIAWIVIYEKRYGPRTQQAKGELAAEFGEIAPPPGSALCDHSVIAKARHVMYESDFTCDCSVDDIRTYYDRQLTARGWTFSGEECYAVTRPTERFRILSYCKGEYLADLMFRSAREGSFSKTFSFMMEWDFPGSADGPKNCNGNRHGT
jgi:hypothetical protein